jgi:transglutaminase-like putative cysteine protease
MPKRCLKTLAFIAAFYFVFNAYSQPVTLAPIPSWVTLHEPRIDVQPKSTEVSGYYYLLIEQQEHVRKQESFRHNAYKFLTNEGIQEMADISINFDPQYQKLIFHKLIVHRDGQKIDRLEKHAIRTIQREQDMDRYIYDGSLTAIINLKDIRVGDVIEFAYTVKGYNPIYEGHISHRIYLNYSLPYEKGIKRLIVPTETNLYFQYKNDASKPVVETSNGNTSYTWESEQVEALLQDSNIPSWYDPYQVVQVTDFKTWEEVVDWSLKHFDVKTGEWNALKKHMDERWTASDENIILEIIRFVQDEIRYLGFEAGLNSHKPHGPAKVFNQRFGDCKDKSLLLSTILQQKGISAYPMLVNTSNQKYLHDQLPSIHAFDHCVVELNWKNKKVYIDPTISNQGGKLDNIYFPNYGAGLVIRKGETNLTNLPEPLSGGIHEQDTFKLNFLEGEATLAIRTSYKGGDADNQRSYFAGNSLESTQKSYVDFYANLYPEIKTEELLKTNDDREKNIFIVEEKYKVPSFWKKNTEVDGQMYAEFYSLSLENLVNVSKSSQRNSPYRLAHPTSFQHTMHVALSPEWNFKSEETDITSDAYKYRYELSYIENTLRIYHRYTTLKDHIPAADVSKFVKDHQAMKKNLSYMIGYDSGVRTSSGFNWVPLIVGVITVGLSLLMVKFLYFKYDPIPSTGAGRGQPIGGWLILVAIGLSITPLRLIIDIFNIPEFFDPTSWSALWNSDNGLLFSVFFFEYVYNIFYFFFSILLVILFFNKRSSIPLLISVFYGTTFIVTLIDTLIAMNLNETYTSTDQQEYYQDLIRSFFAAVIWIPYFNISERVKDTFVERIEPKQGKDNTVTYTLRN